jgi:outer membrane protein TolC
MEFKMRKNVFLFVLTACFCFAVLVQAQSLVDDLTLEMCIQKAISTNVDLLECYQNVECANQKIKEAKALYYPNLDLNINFSHFNNMRSSLISDNMSQVPIFLPSGKKELHYTSRISIWQNIYSGGRIKTTNKLTQINSEKIKNEKDIVKNKVINDIKLIFNECLYFKELLEFDLAKVMDSELGKVHLPSSEIKKLKRKCLEDQLSYDKEVLNLLAAIGKEFDSIVKVSGEIVPKIKHLDLATCLFLASQFRAELKSSQYQESVDNLTLSLLSLQKFPVLTIGAAQEYIGERIFNDNTNWYVSLNANIPIFDGGALFARIRQGKIKLRQTTLSRTKSEKNIRLCVTKAFWEYNFWKSRTIDAKLLGGKKRYNEEELELIRTLNKSYYKLEFAVGVGLDSY